MVYSATDSPRPATGHNEPRLRVLREGAVAYERGGRFVKAPPSVIADATLSERARLLYCLLVMHHNPERGCFPRRKLLAAELGCGVRSMDRALVELERRGLIRRTHPKAGDLTHYELPLVTGDHTPLPQVTTPLATGDDPPLSPVATRTRLKEQDQRTTSAARVCEETPTPSFKPTYAETLNGSYKLFRDKFAEVDRVEFNDGWFRTMLARMELEVGSLTEKQLKRGLGIARNAYVRRIAADPQHGKNIGSPRPYLESIIEARLKEQQQCDA